MRPVLVPSARPRPGAVALALMLLLVVAGCGAGRDVARDTAGAGGPVGRTAGLAPPIALVVTDGGLAGVPVGTSTPRWVVPGAVAAPDGSAVFTVRPMHLGEERSESSGYEVQRVDRRTGTVTPVGRPVAGPPGVRVAAVAPGGTGVALVAWGKGDTTMVVDFDPVTASARAEQTFEGEVEPEAYSLDGTMLFAARIYEDRYHVHVLDMATGEQYPTSGRDKLKPPEDMDGSVVQAVLSPDGTQLATLYRDTTSPDHTGFVHLLALDGGTTVCIDLHAPFGTGVRGTDAIAWREDGTVAVGHRPDGDGARVTATFDPAAIWAGPILDHYHAEVEAGGEVPVVPDGVAATPGFRRYVALAV